MLIPVEVYLEGIGVSQMSLSELLASKDKIFEKMKSYEDDKYTERILELEVHMNPKPSVHYCWSCYCLIQVCEIIISNIDCTEKLKKICKADIKNARAKIKNGLYDNPKEAFQKYRELKGII